MPEITESILKKQLKTNEIGQMYLIYGTESYLKHHYLSELLKKCVDKDFADFNFHSFDGRNVDIKEVALAAEALPMMSERTCVLIKDLVLSNLGESGKKELLSLVSDMPESCVLIICQLTAESDSKGWREIINAFSKYGFTLKLDKMSRNELAGYVVKGAAKRGCEIDNRLADYFISNVGDNMNNVINELDKLCSYANGKIKKEDIDKVTVKTAEVRIFELSKNIVAGNCRVAFSILDSLIKQKEEPVSILATVIMSYVDMYRAKTAAAAGRRPEEAAAVFNYGKNDFRLKNGLRNASKMSVSDLRKSLDILAKADEKLKSASIDGRLILEETLTKLFLAANGESVC